jgi:hypothetical protein
MQLFSEKQATPLCEIMGRYGSDKGSHEITTSWHNYTTFYYNIFKNIQNEPLRIFELGLGTNNTSILSNMGEHGKPGASLYGWREFFPYSKIFGADIDSGILFEAENIKTYYCDQTNPQIIQKMWNEPGLEENFNIIIEDGLHTFEANVCFFENSIHKLKNKGIYIIEDIQNTDLLRFNKKITEWKRKYSYLSLKLISIPSTVNYYDNNLLCAWRF